MTGIGFQSFFAVAVVLALVGAMAWLARRGAFGALAQRNRGIAVETAVPLGERRSLVIVAVEGRRLLLGLTPAQISMVTELGPAAAATAAAGGDGTPGQGTSGAPKSFEQQLATRLADLFKRREMTTSGTPVVADAAPLARVGDILQLSTQQS